MTIQVHDCADSLVVGWKGQQVTIGNGVVHLDSAIGVVYVDGKAVWARGLSSIGLEILATSWQQACVLRKKYATASDAPPAFTVALDHGADLDALQKAVVENLKAYPYRLDPLPVHYAHSFDQEQSIHTLSFKHAFQKNRRPRGPKS